MKRELSLGRASGWSSTGLIAVAGALAIAVGVAASFDPMLAIALLGAIALLALTIAWPNSLPAVLMASVFVENISFGGTTISQILAPVALITVVIELIRGRASVEIRSPLVWAGAYSIWAVASAFWTVSEARTLDWLTTLVASLAYMLAFAGLMKTREDLRRAVTVGVLVSLVSGLIGFLSFAQGAFRAAGEIGDANFFAAYQIVALPMALVLLAQSKRGPFRWLLLISVAVIIVSILTSLSRGGLLTLVVIVLLVLALPARAIFRSRLQKTAVVAVIAAGMVAALAVSFQSLSARVESLTTGQEAAGSGRLNEWRAAWHAFNDQPILGLGFGAFPAVSNELVRRTPGADLVHFDLRPEGTLAHNAYLGTLADIGFFGFVFFLGLLVSTARLLQVVALEARHAGEQFIAYLSNALLLSFIGFCIASIFLSSETARPLWIIVGIALAVARLVRSSGAMGAEREMDGVVLLRRA